MKYRIDVKKEIKFMRLPNGSEISTEATDCEMELWTALETERDRIYQIIKDRAEEQRSGGFGMCARVLESLPGSLWGKV